MLKTHLMLKDALLSADILPYKMLCIHLDLIVQKWFKGGKFVY